jgi:transposase
MKVEQVLSLPEGLEVTNIEEIDGVLTISAVSTQQSVCCPLCSSVATRVHSHYTRTIADLPCAGQPVCLLMQVRKFFCDVKACARKIFVERLAPFVAPLARVTTRLSESVEAHRVCHRWHAWSALNRSLRDTDVLDDHSPPHNGTTNRASRTGSGVGNR